MSQDFSTWSRDDFNAFDAQRTLVFQPTAEELAQAEANKQAQLQALIVKVQGELSQYGITFLGTETDFKDLYTQYIIGAPDMREQFWDNLQGTVDYQYSIGNNLQAFMAFVSLYE